MYVCLCSGVTDKDIKRAASNGATSVEDLKNTLGVASQCGSCAQAALDVLYENLVNDTAAYYQVA